MDDKNFEVCDISKMNLSVNMVTLMILRYIRLGIIYFYKYRNIELWAVYNPVKFLPGRTGPGNLS